MPSDDSPRVPRRTRGVKLDQVYPPPENTIVTDIDIIAIHGLDTDSTTTWKWKHSDPEKLDVDWLKDPNMLPHRVPKARIFTCDWPASLFKDNHTIQTTVKELARSLLLGIRSRPGAIPNPPILFIASCLGGIILTQAMDIAAEPGSKYNSEWEATIGIVFLATPFRGTAFQNVAKWAVPLLEVRASLTNNTVNDLLGSVKESTPFLQDLVGSFTRICRQRDQPCQLAIFYETKKGNFLRKVLPPGLADTLNEPKLLVDSSSARLDIVLNPVPLERNHIEMNKFSGPDDLGYKAVSGQIDSIIRDSREARLIDKARVWMRDRHYSEENLKIKRLSGASLPMDQCYINLTIVEQSRDGATGSARRFGIQGASPFSLLARLGVETPQEGKEVTLPTLFEPRMIRDSEMRPSRILIRGRAGVGKTTLCKKIIYDFTRRRLWRGLFDHVFWVPLRNLKLEARRTIPGYNLRHLFHHEYFSQNREGDKLAEALWHTLTDTKCGRALFILDGLDEISRDLGGDMSGFLKELLNQPNVIITSRPNASLLPELEPLHLELETIGFQPDQVNAYIESTFTDDPGMINKIQSFLHGHTLIRSLVRIPIQLDAFCYTWDDFRNKDAPETMTSIYQSIELSLWKKDIINMQIESPERIEDATEHEVECRVEKEIRFLEILAFSGMYSDIIEFEWTHLERERPTGMLGSWG
ncbi:hypothetical protein O1611_g9537 [Lasiodiplodia mahajangana]|uniref:Uncharacterized protein n=1 Tax=Lasiodiplodia mahajangana TaxID=1108764 RepID=A0ACC2J8L3_9PEZI|nr:hypothetical protein O1611_g9537 [Lasiodiplodia mahajangana]